MGANVPSCPDWTVADLVRHVAVVYLHKVECMRRGRPEIWPPPGLEAEDPLALLDRAYGELSREFAERSPTDSAYTWYDPDQTVGFWIRRMAHETAIHRVDAELSAGAPTTQIPEDMACDGINEFLFIMAGWASRAWREDFVPILASADGRAVRIEVPGAAWLVRPTTEGVDVREVAVEDESEQAAAGVNGEPDSMLLWMWNRAAFTEDHGVMQKGDAGLVAYLHELFLVGSQ